jgi:hypothetical protein
MTSNEELPAEARKLIDAYCSGLPTPAEVEQLESLLCHSEAARRFYLKLLDLHAQLAWSVRRQPALQDSAAPEQPLRPAGAWIGVSGQAETQGIGSIATPAAALPSKGKRLRFRRIHGIAAGALAAAASLFLAWRLHSPPQPPSTVPPLAVVVETLGGWWGPNGREIRPGEPLPGGVLELLQGAMRLRFAEGAEVVVEGPARLKPLDARTLFLWSGRVVAQFVGPPSSFIIDTPHARLTDMGTEFGVGVDFSGATEIQVFEGTVVANLKNADNEPTTRQQIDAGQAWQLDVDRQPQLQPMAFTPGRFLRTLPPRRRNDLPPGPLFNNQPRFDTVHIVPAQPGLRIDGDLSDWDHSAMFRSACREPYGRHYYVAGAMMYDAGRFYIGAHVGDPAPMCNAIDPETDPTNSWRGGSIVVRLSTDKGLGWPLDVLRPDLRKSGPYAWVSLNDRSEQLAHLTLFYHRPTRRARLELRYGMDFHGRILDPPGWQGAFRADADGQGYTLEYAVPWTLLHADHRPPAAGDVLAGMWSVHWSDREGRLCLGHLTDIVNSSFRPYLSYQHQYGASWGRAIYHGQGNLPPGTIVGPRIP